MDDSTKNITLRIPEELYADIQDDLQEVALEIKKERGKGHVSENAALVRLIQEAIEARRGAESKKAARQR